MNAPLRGTCSRPRCWSPATTLDRDGRRVCRPDCQGGSGLGDLPVVRLEDLPPVAGPAHHIKPKAPPSAMTSRVLLAIDDGLQGRELRHHFTRPCERANVATVLSNLRGQGLVRGEGLTGAGRARVAELRALLAAGGGR